MVARFLSLLIPLLIALYTFNYARWCTRQKLFRGAAGLFVMAALCIAVPMLVLWWTS